MKPLIKGTPRSAKARLVMWAGLAAGGAVTSLVGCQAEYAGMTLPSGKYLYDDVQYFAPGPDFPWANTNAAVQRARMQQLGIDVGELPVPGTGGPITPPTAAGAGDPTQMRGGAANVNSQLNPPGGRDIPPPPGFNQNVPPPPNPGGENVPPPGEVR
jgi:hypothetical protein